jgi:antitoxin ParD1/3/4
MDMIDKADETLYDSGDGEATLNHGVPMSLSLQPETERLIEEKLESGNYDSADKVVLDALRALSHEDEQYSICLGALRGEIQKGIDSLDAGLGSPKDEVFARLRARRGRAPV